MSHKRLNEYPILPYLKWEKEKLAVLLKNVLGISNPKAKKKLNREKNYSSEINNIALIFPESKIF